MSSGNNVLQLATLAAVGVAGYFVYQEYKKVTGVVGDVIQKAEDVADTVVCEWTLARFWDPLHVCDHKKSQKDPVVELLRDKLDENTGLKYKSLTDGTSLSKGNYSDSYLKIAGDKHETRDYGNIDAAETHKLLDYYKDNEEASMVFDAAR